MKTSPSRTTATFAITRAEANRLNNPESLARAGIKNASKAATTTHGNQVEDASTTMVQSPPGPDLTPRQQDGRMTHRRAPAAPPMRRSR